jgi:hypothetical protein
MMNCPFNQRQPHLNQPQGQMLPMYQDMQGGGTINPQYQIPAQTNTGTPNMPAGQPNVNQENNTHTKIEEITDDETPFMNVETLEHYFNDEGYTEDSFLLPYDSDNEECEETVN